jgi:hypothetical protein
MGKAFSFKRINYTSRGLGAGMLQVRIKALNYCTPAENSGFRV